MSLKRLLYGFGEWLLKIEALRGDWCFILTEVLSKKFSMIDSYKMITR
jgi:hypothetical protein